MSNELVTIDNQMQVGGVGLGASIFRARPQSLELVQRTTRQEGAIPGKFRNIATNEHWDEMRVVLLAVPQEQREWYSGAEFSKDSKQCFSLDNTQPHIRAKNPPAMYCASCSKGDLNWAKWRTTKDAKDLPPCNMYYHLSLADRATQVLYNLNCKGTSVMPFKAAMETQMAGLFQKIVADVKAKNRALGYSFAPKTGTFIPNAGTVPTEAPLPMPNIFDISFTLFVTSRDKGGPPVIGLKDFKLMNDADRAEFGALYAEQVQRKIDGRAAAEEQAAAAVEAEANAAVTGQAPPAPALVLPGPVVEVVAEKVKVEGVVVTKEDVITI